MEKEIKQYIRDVKDFPQPGIVFKDITPLFEDPDLCSRMVQGMADKVRPLRPDAIAGIESRGFLFGFAIAQALDIPFVIIRKAGKLPHFTLGHKYDLEYGSAELEIHRDSIHPGWRVVIHDDLLATGGTAGAAAELIRKMEGMVAGFIFLVHLSFLSGNGKLSEYSDHIYNLVEY